MNPYAAYQTQANQGWTRIDVVLALFDGAIERLEKALEALRQNDADAVLTLTQRARLIVGELAASLDLSYGELPQNLMRLYEFVLYSVGQGGSDKLEAAVKVLRNLREGFQGIREEAVQLERSGQIPPVEEMRSIQTEV